MKQKQLIWVYDKKEDKLEKQNKPIKSKNIKVNVDRLKKLGILNK